MQTLVIGLNPAVDVEWRVSAIHWDEKNVVQGERRWAGGKSVNVARWLRHLGGPVRLLVPLGGSTGAELKRQLRGERVPLCALPVAEPTRANVMVTQEAGPQLRFNPKGPKLSGEEWRKFFALAEAEMRRSALVILSGALCRDARATIYRDLIRLARRLKLPCVLDCDGPAFAAGAAAGPLLVKPNEFELAQWAGRKLGSSSAVVQAAGELSRATGGWVLVSRDAQGGLLLHAEAGVGWQAGVPKVRACNTVGAGDALLAAAARQIRQGAPPVEWLRQGLATATAFVQFPAGELAPAKAVEAMLKQIQPKPL